MAKFEDIVSGVEQHTARTSAELRKDREEWTALRASWQRFNELDKQIQSKERKVGIGVGLLRKTPRKALANEWAEGTECDLKEFSLWRIIREVVRQAKEMRIYELEEHLKSFGLSVTRPAVESAIAVHSKEFRVTKRGREKFVALK
jgi:histone H3/H4